MLGVLESAGLVKALTVLPDDTVVSGNGDGKLQRWSTIPSVLTGQQWIDILEALKANTSVESVVLTRSSLSPEALALLLAVLNTHPTLHNLSLHHCGIDAKAITQIVDALAQGVHQHQCLPKTLSLEGNPGLDAPEVPCRLALGYFPDGGLVTDVPQGVKRLTQLAEECHTMAQWCLGLLYITGIGIASHADTAQSWFAKARTQELPPLTALLALASEHSVFRTQQGLTVYHLMALMGDVRWYAALQGLSDDERQAWGLGEDTVLAKSQQGLRASSLARQQGEFLALDKDIKPLSPEALADPVLQAYSACAKALRQGEEEAQLAKLLRAQQTQVQTRANYGKQAQALLNNIDTLRVTPPWAMAVNAGGDSDQDNLLCRYATLLQQLWGTKQALIQLKDTPQAYHWPVDFNPFSIQAPAQCITLGVEATVEGTSPLWLRMKVKTKGRIAYVMAERDRLRDYGKIYEEGSATYTGCTAAK